ncbi:MAG TPA: acyl-CoA dehydrogenase family protein [Parachlamydiaceae bacterium]|nr:acyl-CoA dehydrogenase family protein [Parachlamydiaceae bacterium]
MDEQQRQMAEEILFSDKKKSGFGMRLYFGDFDSSKVFPYPTLPADEAEKLQDYLAQVKIFADTVIDPDWIDRHAEIPQSVIQGLAKLGLLGMTVPKESGGLGMSQHAYCKATEIIAGRCAATALFINAHQSIGLKALLLFGTNEQKQRWLIPLARGEEIAAFSLTEPNAGSDAAGVETRAVLDPVKKVYRINGKKQWTTNGSMAGVLTVMAKTEVYTPQGKKDKVTAFLITPDMPGFKVTAAALEKVGMRGSRTANLEFVDMEVPVENILGPLGGGLKVCLTVLDYGRTTFGAACTGGAKFLVEKAVNHAKTRFQFNRPLASFGLVKKKIARMSALTYAMDAATYLTAGFVDEGDQDIMVESAILKVFASDSLWEILYDTMQIYGGRSFFTDQPFERMMRDARLNMIGEGSNEVMRAFIGVVGMRDVGLELKGFLDALGDPINNRKGIWKFLGNNLTKLRLPEVKVRSENLQHEAKQLAQAVRNFGFAVIRLLKEYREDILENQLELERIANSAIAIYTAAAVLGKLDAAMGADGTANETPQQIASGKLYCQMAFDTVEKNLDALFSPLDEVIEKLSDDITGLSQDSRKDS